MAGKKKDSPELAAAKKIVEDGKTGKGFKNPKPAYPSAGPGETYGDKASYGADWRRAVRTVAQAKKKK